MSILILIILVLALVLAGLRGFGVSHPRLHFGWLAIALVILTMVLGNLPG
jgi:hypothetical protein